MTPIKTGRTRDQLDECLCDVEAGSVVVMVCRSPGARYEQALARHMLGRRRWNITEGRLTPPQGPGRLLLLPLNSNPERLRGMKIHRLEFDHAIGGAGLSEEWYQYIDVHNHTKDIW